MAHAEGPLMKWPFDHRQHLRFAWAVLSELPTEDAIELLGSEIRAFAETRAPGKYHETMTQFWVRLVAHTRSIDRDPSDFDAHLQRFPILLDAQAPTRRYSSVVLGSHKARAAFVPPDLLPIP
jgi:hypothetical protein